MKTLHLPTWFSSPCLILLAALLACPPIALRAATTESNLNKTFAVKPGGQLIMDADRGSITLKTSDRADLVVEVKRKITGEGAEKAQEIFADHEVFFDQDGDRIEVRAKFKTDPNRWFNRGRVNLNVEYLIQLPKQFNLDLRTGAGSIASTDIEGNVKIHSSGGDLRFTTVKGPFDGSTGAGSVTLDSATGQVSVKSSGGDIRLGQMDDAAIADTGAGSVTVKSAKGKLSVHSSGGDLRLGSLEAEAEATTGAGSITVETAKSKLKIKSSGGDLRLGQLNGETMADTGAGSISVDSAKDKLTVKTSGGDIRLGKLENEAIAQTSAGSISVKSSQGKLFIKSNGGDLRIENAAGTVEAHTGAGSVSANFSAQPKEDCSLSTSGGDIRVKLGENLAFNLDAKTSGGEVETELPVTSTISGKPKSGELKGTINSGGKILLLKTGAGNITIRKL